NVIHVKGSGDGGANWTAAEIVNSGGSNTAGPNPNPPRMADPQMVFTQGSADNRVPGGQLVFAWNDFGNTTFLTDASRPDGGAAATLGATSFTATATAATGLG